MQKLRDRAGASSGLLLLLIACAIGATGWFLGAFEGGGPNQEQTTATSKVATAGARGIEASIRSKSSGFPTTIRQPAGPPRVATGVKDIHGNEVTVRCGTCHTTREPDVSNKACADLTEFHGSLELNHGNITCLSCHNSNDYDALKLADGSRVEFVDVMELCGQCHGPQMKDYEHGTHGGMTGHWDLSRGPRTKNNCVDCHHPHSPQFPSMQPTFKPRDRFLEATDHGSPLHSPSHGDPK